MTVKPEKNIKAVFFDLDGTLIDTWKDLMNSANHVLALHGFPAMDPQRARLLATDGIAAMLRSVMESRFDEFDFDLLKNEFLDFYLANIHVESCLFPGFEKVLEYFRGNSIRWGIVTNKPGFLARPLIDTFPELHDCSVLVCNETVPKKKPFPDPVLFALKETGTAPENALYVGDHIRDIECGNRAGTQTAAASWGYIAESDSVADWNAGFICRRPEDLLDVFAGGMQC